MSYVNDWLARLFFSEPTTPAVAPPEVGREWFVIEKERLVHVLTAARADGGIDGRKVSRVSFDEKGLVLHFDGEDGPKP